MAMIYYTDGTTKEVQPANGASFTLKEAQAIVGGFVEVVDLPGGCIMILNEEGKLIGLEKNEAATKLAELPTPEERRKYMRIMEKLGYTVIDATDGGEDYIAGNVLVCKDEEFR